MLGNGILIVWTDIPPQIEADFNDWYNREHLPGRIGRMPGFLRGRRYVAESAPAGVPKYLTYYDLQNAAVMMSDAHVALRQQRPVRDRYFVPRFRNTIKGICDVVCRAGSGAGGVLVLQPVTAANVVPGGRDELMSRLAGLTGVACAVYGLRNAEVTRASSAKDDRAGDRYMEGLIAIEAMDAQSAAAARALLNAQNLARAGIRADLLADPCIMRLLFALQAPAAAPG